MKRHDPIYGAGYDYPPMIINPYGFVAAGGGPPVFEIASTSGYESTSAATSHSVPMPTGTAIGDLLVMFAAHGGSSSATWTPPSGWANIVGAASPGNAFWKIAASGDTGSLSFGLSISRPMAACVVRITGAHATDPIAWSAVTALAIADPDNVNSPWGSGNFLGITGFARGNFNTAATTTPVTPPSGTAIDISSAPTDASTHQGVAWSASTTLTSVSAWDAGAWSAASFVSGRVFSAIVRPA